MSLETTIADAAEIAVKNKRSVYWTGCGQSLGALHPAHLFMERESRTVSSKWVNSAELSACLPAEIGEHSLIVAVSHGGTTPEVVDAVKKGKLRKCDTIGLVYKPDSPLEEACDVSIHYEWGPERKISLEKSMCALRLAADIVDRAEGYPAAHEFNDALERIDSIVRKAREKVVEEFSAFAEDRRSVRNFYVVGSGGAAGSGYNQTIAFLQSLWLHSGYIGSGEFRHGPVEIIDTDCAFIVLAGTGPTREFDLKACKAIQAHSTDCLVIDAEALGIDTLDPSVRDYFNFPLFSGALEILNRRLSALKEHPLSLKRYMAAV